MKKIIFILSLAISIILLVSIINYSSSQQKLCFQSSCFNVEIADTSESRTQGLMYRESLDENSGMLFIFPDSGVYPFWMKNTLIPLDIIWINENKEIVYISKNTQPCIQEPCEIINPNKEAIYVLEINAGISDKIGLKEGDVFEFKIN